MKARLKDPDLARLFENTFPNTLGQPCRMDYSGLVFVKLTRILTDTTVKYFNAVSNLSKRHPHVLFILLFHRRRTLHLSSPE